MINVNPLANPKEATKLLRTLRSQLNEKTFEERLARAAAQGYVVLGAFEGDQMVGALGYRITDDLCWGRTLFIDDLIVDPAARSSGVGRALMDEAKTIAATDCDHIRLCSGLSRHDAHRFYENCGLERFSLQFVTSTDGA